MTTQEIGSKGLGCIPQVPDIRDYKLLSPVIFKNPALVDLRKYAPPITDQGALGSCTGHAVAAAYRMVEKKQKIRSVVHSPLFIYYNTRSIEGTVDADAGATLRGTMKSAKNYGASAESAWRYQIHKFKKKPSNSAYASGDKNQVIRYEAVPQDLVRMQACLAEGFPIVIGFAVYESFYSPDVAHTGKAVMPSAGERMLGGHAVVIVGYLDDTRKWIVRNSWGEGWGSLGYFYMPYEYFLDPRLAFDFWTMKVVE